MEDPTREWSDPQKLTAQHEHVGRLRPVPWVPPESPRIAACFVAFAVGEQGPGRTGDRAWVGAVTVRVHRDRGIDTGCATAPPTADSDLQTVEIEDWSVVRCRSDGPYVPGLLAMREGTMLAGALSEMFERSGRPDVLMLDATGRDCRGGTWSCVLPSGPERRSRCGWPGKWPARHEPEHSPADDRALPPWTGAAGSGARTTVAL